LVRAGRGDQDSFACLYDTLGPRVFGLARRVIGNHTQAEEVTQEIFLEVWRKAPEFDHRLGSALAWVLTIAHGRAVDRVRRERSSRDRDDRVARRDSAPPFDQVSERVEVRLEHEAVREALAGLSALQRQALVLAYYEGLTQRQIAERLGAPLGTVKTRLRDGLIRLEAALAGGR
jgi:RNA polymerase sigma-70 factor (ECF subfamily)